MMTEALRLLEQMLQKHPVVASLYGIDQLPHVTASPAPVVIVANIALPDLEPLLSALGQAEKFAFVNLDSCDGLAQDKAGVEYLRRIGTSGIVTTRSMLVQRANALGMVTMQKVFITDRSTLPRSINSVAQSKPHYVQLMPWPVVASMSESDLAGLSPFIAAGFVQSKADVVAALRAGARGVSTSDAELWRITRAAKTANDPSSQAP
ncbi:glycerol-3-phosphate responsive antiterminator [Lysinibacter cavernae]|uniref:Glycerol uptake operon antiterminator n=1 Tax=Lysinibacter cavernae TaxID=1640652 RepID=A0A7X5TUU3_9MICO|nr:glycerol-3-phosphate responsive antiterminator [Lysinibacter cavernae]NIH53962.1 glycerol uptake operon antiterminator [Lysinibacter cavernae]